MPVTSLNPALDPQSKASITRVDQIADNGYHVNTPQITEIDSVLKYLRSVGKQPSLYYNIEASANHNLLENAGDLAQVIKGASTVDDGVVQAITGQNIGRQLDSMIVATSSAVLNAKLRPSTTYNASVYLKKVDGADLTNYSIKVVQNNGTVHSSTNVTVTGEYQRVSFDFTTDANADPTLNSLFHIIQEGRIHRVQVSLPQITEGAGVKPFQSRDDNTPEVINLGTNSTTGDGALSGSNLSEMTEIDATAGRVMRFKKSNGNGLDTSYVPYPTAGDNNVTLGAWIKFDNLGTDEWVISQSTELVLRKIADNRMEFLLNSFATNDRVRSVTNMTTDQWFFVVGVYSDADNVMRIYLDGVENNTINPTGTWGGNASTLKVGYSFAHMDGNVGDVMLIEDSLTAAEVLQVYNLTKNKYIQT